MEPIESFQKRLEKALKIKNVKPVELHEKTGISESLLSKYLSGNAVARQRKMTLISDTLDINPVWLMGYDVPMEKNIRLDKLGNPVVSIPILRYCQSRIRLFSTRKLDRNYRCRNIFGR